MAGKILSLPCVVALVFSVLPMILVWPQSGMAQAIPALSQIPPCIADTRPDLVNERTSIQAERQSLHARVNAQAAQCSDVEENTQAAVTCLQVRAELQAAMKAHANRSNAFNASVPTGCDAPLRPAPAKEHHYNYAGNGLIAGTTWTIYAARKPGEAQKRMCDVVKHQSELAGSPYDAGVDCSHYQFVLGMATSVDAFSDLTDRVLFDELTNGQFSAQEQGLYDKLRDKQFDELGCHSNGAMICLAALENEDVKATHVVLYGPQVTRESLAMWDQLVRDGKVKSVKVYINENDIVPGASIAFMDGKIASEKAARGAADFPFPYPASGAVAAGVSAGASAVPLFKLGPLKDVINVTAPRLEVQTFPCKLDRAGAGCHGLDMYKSKVNCTGKSSGAPVPGTHLPGKADLPEPPLPCEALGAKPE
jgi:hypothetical protein